MRTKNRILGRSSATIAACRVASLRSMLKYVLSPRQAEWRDGGSHEVGYAQDRTMSSAADVPLNDDRHGKQHYYFPFAISILLLLLLLLLALHTRRCIWWSERERRISNRPSHPTSSSVTRRGGKKLLLLLRDGNKVKDISIGFHVSSRKEWLNFKIPIG